jgi:glutathione peroxidase
LAFVRVEFGALGWLGSGFWQSGQEEKKMGVPLRVLTRHLGLAGLAIALLAAGAAAAPAESKAVTAFDFSFEALNGAPLPLAGFKGKTLLVVNTASFCGYTPQYAGLQDLWERYREQGLVVVGVPSNDFGAQEPGSSQEIKQFCEVNFDVDFPMTAKQTVIGEAAHPFYRWAAEELGESAAPRWNFHKYLIGPDGAIAGTFPSKVEPLSSQMIEAVESHLPRR